MSRLVIGIGGNALLRRGQRADAAVQQANLTVAVGSLAGLAAEHDVVLVHGNGPQVGMLALETSADRALERPYPLDVLVAETQGMIGYWLAAALGTALPGREVAAVLTQTLVDAEDPAFAWPTKFIGPGYDRAEAATVVAAHGWDLRRDGRQWRRVVPSPEPRDVAELGTIRRLVQAGAVVIAAGGGGVPVAVDADGNRRGVEAVVDKDLAAALLAERLDADALLLLTDVPAVYRDFGTPSARPVTEATAADLERLGLPDGSMGPKVEACRRFLTEQGRAAAIGELADAAAILAGTAGTRVLPEGGHNARCA
ncbi:carbamate kinase [Amycolatopsis cihanbeyliensis]|uniref:Carbamate kinase n=1 Tax=Amycolatopsis cihanbeyliensis TaxID=1128664 RepID=A0A542DE15_AMYCI|nr:carbamate kinase [Amycolatopsis cihanbeyliensis]TQJ01315.1 carbamate kinase [Amycolatopsis cihanbeyliensis]